MSKRPLKILFISSEVSPYIKTGGLGDVAGSLPKALRAKDVDVRVVMPKFSSIDHKHFSNARFVAAFNVHLAWRVQEAKIYSLDSHNNGESVYFIENDYYFARDNLYGYDDDYERFAFFTKAAIEMLMYIDFKADIVHSNDWHSGLSSTYLKGLYRDFKYYSDMKSLFTIHNINYQGIFGRSILWDIGLNDGYFTNGELEFHGNISFLKAGIIHSDAVNTVSQTYAHEITTPSYGYGMDGLLHKRNNEDRLFGIVNGIDADLHNPATDPQLFANFTVGSPERKKDNKHRLQEMLGLPVGDTPVLSMITRLAEQKGLDIVSLIMEELMSLDIQLVILGTGEGRYENMFRHFAYRFPHKVSANITFDSTLAQRIYAGSDMFLMPSAYEPCGLGQLFAMRYGAIPIVRRTGGLADTVKHFNRDTGIGNGFSFEDCVASGLMWAIREALGAYQSLDWQLLVKNAMGGNFSWDNSANLYIDLYHKVMKM